MPGLEVPHRVGDLSHQVGPVDDRDDLTGVDPLGQVGQVLRAAASGEGRESPS